MRMSKQINEPNVHTRKLTDGIKSSFNRSIVLIDDCLKVLTSSMGNSMLCIILLLLILSRYRVER